MPDRLDNPLAHRVLAALVGAVPAAVLLVDSDGTILHANQATNTVFDYNPTNLIGRHYELLVPEGASAGAPGPPGEVPRRGGPAAPADGCRPRARGPPRDGTHVPIEVALAPISLGDDILVGVFVRT